LLFLLLKLIFSDPSMSVPIIIVDEVEAAEVNNENGELSLFCDCGELFDQDQDGALVCPRCYADEMDGYIRLAKNGAKDYAIGRLFPDNPAIDFPGILYIT